MNNWKQLSFLLVEERTKQSSAVLDALLAKAQQVRSFVSIANGELPSLDPYDAVLICTTAGVDQALDIIEKCNTDNKVVPAIFIIHLNEHQGNRMGISQIDKRQLPGWDMLPSDEQVVQFITEVTAAIELQRNAERHDHAHRGNEASIVVDVDNEVGSDLWKNVNQIGHSLLETHDTEEIISAMLRNAVKIIKAAEASIWIWEDENKETLVCHATSNPVVEQVLKTIRMPRGQGIAGWVVEHQVSTIAFDTIVDPRFYNRVDEQTGFTTESILAVPLRYGDRVLGVLQVLNKRSGMFSMEDANLVETLARSATIALENARLVTELNEKTNQLERRNEELDNFAGTVAHDIQRILTNCSFNFEMMLDTPEDKPEEYIEYRDGVRHNVERMRELVESMLHLAKIHSEPFSLETVAVRDTVDAAVDELSMLIDNYDAKIEIRSEIDSCPTVCGYGTWVERVWVNYISNAVKYGGDKPTIVLGCDKDEENVTFWVQDSGKGLTEKRIQNLFEPFPEFRDTVNGTGLGLSIVRRIVERMNGTVSAESEIDKGSRFMFTLPKA